MKSFRYFLLSIFLIVLARPVFAKISLSFIDPGLKKTIPVYSVDKNGMPTKTEVTSVFPGDFVAVKEVRQSKDGQSWFVIKAKSKEGQDIELAMSAKSLDWDLNDPDKSKIWNAAPNARKIKQTGDEASQMRPEPGMDPEMCSMKMTEDCATIAPGGDLDIEDAVLVQSSEGESKFKWRNYYKDKSGKWINGDETSRVSEYWSNIQPTKAPDCDNKDQPFKEIQQGAEDLKVGSDEQLDLVMKNIGDCHSNMDGDYHARVIETVAKKPLAVMYKEMRMPDKSLQIVHANRKDWVAIDVLARTLYGEMASCFKKGKQYPESVSKVILNRVDFKQANPKLGKRFINADPANKNADYRNDITNAVFMDKQFSVWNRNDPARRMAMCPPSNPDKEFWTGAKPGPEEQKIWKDAVRIASQAVLQGETFRMKNKDLTALYYTSDMELPKKHYEPVADASIGGKKIPMSRCVQLWKSKELAQLAPGVGMFHPFFQKALLQIAGH